jgi:hypothetical protein
MSGIANATTEPKAPRQERKLPARPDPIGETIAAGRAAGLTEQAIVVELYRLMGIEGLLRELVDSSRE